jgi:WD40 repeat protein
MQRNPPISKEEINQQHLHQRVPYEPVVQAIAWHPYQQRFAVAYSGRCIRVFNLHQGAWEERELTHPSQHGIRCMTWSPLAGATLAVGCAGGVCVWRICSPGRGQSSAAHRQMALPAPSFLSHPGRTDGRQDKMHPAPGSTPPLAAAVDEVQWSADGRLLVTAARSRSELHLWTEASQSGLARATTLRPPPPSPSPCAALMDPIRFLFPPRVTQVLWSPDGAHLLALTDSCDVLVWSCGGGGGGFAEGGRQVLLHASLCKRSFACECVCVCVCVCVCRYQFLRSLVSGSGAPSAVAGLGGRLALAGN